MFGQPMMFFLNKKNKLKIYYPSENKFFYGESNSNNINRMIGFDLEPAEFIHLITANVKLAKNGDYLFSAFTKEDLIYFTIKEKNDIKLVLLIDSKRLVLKKISKFKNETNIIWETIYENYKTINGYLLPINLSINMPVANMSIDLVYKGVSLNKTLPVNIYNLELPKSVEKINLDKQ